MSFLSIDVHDITFALQDIGNVGNTYLTKGKFEFYHYGCDGFNDRGWGCGYRTLQSMCSWIINNVEKHHNRSVPDILSIQNTLVDIGDKIPNFVGSRDWIGSIEVGMVIDQLFGVPCKILHLDSGLKIKDNIECIIDHFNRNACLIMMGGNADCSSKGIAGVHIKNENIFLLIVDPHYVGKAENIKSLQASNWVTWHPVEDLLDCSFYNICLPQINV